MAEWSLPRKVRKSNFSTDEVDVLVDSVKANYGVLYGKYAKRATNKWIRQEAWMDILKKVNGVSIEKRTLQEVKNKWKKCQYALKEKGEYDSFADDAGDSPYEDLDSMPLQERLSKMAAQEKIAAGAAGQQVLKSQPLSPTKLKVTRHATKVKPAEPPPSPVNEEMCLRWNSHHSNMQTAFPSILSKEQYVDVTLAAEGKTLKCHRLILSSCSPYFEEILSGISPLQHPVLFMRDIPFWILKSLCDFMYAGEVHIYQNKLEELLTVAEALKIKGLAGKSTPPENNNQQQQQSNSNRHNNNNKEVKKKNQEKEKTHLHPPQLRKNPRFDQMNSYESTSHDFEDDLLDPLELLEPLYEEAAEEKKPTPMIKPKEPEKKFPYQPMKKPFGRRLRKRKLSEQREPSPPPVFSFRKGTRSRPNVKIPKYYHSDYTNPPKPSLNSQTDPLLDVDEIKTEPIDVEDNTLVDYGDDDHYLENSLETANCNSPIIITKNTKPSNTPNLDKFKKIKLTKPIITEVHTIEEAKTTAGGLEVIKITVQQKEVDRRGEEEVVEEPVKTVVIECTEVGEETENTAVESIAASVPEEGASETDVPIKEGVPETVVPVEKGAPETDVPVEKGAPETDVPMEEGAPETDVPMEEGAPESIEDSSEKDLPTECDVPVEDPAESAPVLSPEGVPCQETVEETVANCTEETTEVPVHIQIENIRSECIDEQEEERRTTSLNHLEKEAMNVANAINMENQAPSPSDIE